MNRKRQCENPKTLQLLTAPIRRSVALFLASGLLLASSGVSLQAQTLDTSKPVRGQVSISRDVNVTSAKDKISLNMRNANLRDVLNTIAMAGQFNLILDASVEGSLTVDVKDLSINKALEYIFTVSDLSYIKDGNTVIVTTKANAEEKNMNVKTLKAIPVLYREAEKVAEKLNETVFKVPRSGGSTKAVASFDADSNSLLVMGTETDIKLVADALRELDVPRNRKVYHIKHGDPARVASVLAANFFQSGGESSGGSGAGAGVAAGAAGAGGVNLQMNTFSAGGVTFISEPISATLTVLGTDEQLALIDSVIDQVDVRRPQAVIEVSLVEIQSAELKSLVPQWGAFDVGREGRITLNVLDADGLPTGVNNFNFLKSNFASAKNFLSSFSLNQSHKSTRAKILANPTIVALDGTASQITITDQVPNINQTTSVTNGVAVVTTQIETQEAGVNLTMTPRIFNDGSVELNLQPMVSQPLRTVSSGGATVTLISTRSMNLAAVRVKDGQTLVLGGLLRETKTSDIDKIPGIDKLPILRAMFNATNGDNRNRTELVLMVTPHILKEDAVTYFNKTGGKYSNMNQGQGGMQPVSLPKFIGGATSPELLKNTGIKPANDTSSMPVTLPAELSQPAEPKVEKGAAPKEAKPLDTKIDEELQPRTDLQKSMLPPKEEMIPLRPASNLSLRDAYRTPSDRAVTKKSKKSTAKAAKNIAPPAMLGEVLKN